MCGTIAILVASHPQLSIVGFPAWKVSAVFILLAAVADFFDGFAARMLHSCHPIGADLDSLSDEVSFGVAPAVLLSFALWGNVSPWLTVIPVLIPVASAVRLAKFNNDTRQTTGFLGMPVPANAVFWIGYVACYKGGAEYLANPWVLTLSVLALSWLMVSEVPMLSLKFKTWGLKDNLARYLLIITSAALLVCLKLPGLLLIIVFYYLLSLGTRPRRTSSKS